MTLITRRHIFAAAASMHTTLEDGTWSLTDDEPRRLKIAMAALGGGIGLSLDEVAHHMKHTPAFQQLSTQLMHSFERAYLELEVKR